MSECEYGSLTHSPKVLLSRDVSSHPSTVVRPSWNSCNDNKGNEKKKRKGDEVEYHEVGGAH